jgi:hypothetical protein
MGSLVHHGPMAGVSGELSGVAPGGQFRGIFFTVSGGKGGGGLRDPHRRQMGAVRRRWCPDVDERRRRCVELGGRGTQVRMERTDARVGTVVWRRCSRAAFIGWGRLAGATEERSQRRWVLNSPVSTLIQGGESMGHRASAREGRRPGGGSIQLHPSAGGGWTAARRAAATNQLGGGGSGGRWKTAGLTDSVAHLSVRGRQRADWARKGGRRWAAAGLEKEGGGRTKTVARAEIQKNKKKNQF